jgi:hypothetical protein
MAVILASLGAETAPEARRFAIVIGINQYADQTILQLQKAQKDAEDLAAVLASGGSFKSVKLMSGALAYVDPLFPTRNNIINQVEQLGGILKPSDQVLFFFSGHGLNDPASGDSYLLAIDASARDFAGTSVNLQKDVLGRLEAAGVGNVLALVDACQKTVTRDKGLSVMGVDRVKPVSRAVVITATGPGKASYEDPKGANGLFTRGLLEAFNGAADLDRNGELSVAELERFLPDTVSEYAYNASLSQTPTVYDSGNGAGQPSLGKPGRLAAPAAGSTGKPPAGAVSTAPGDPAGAAAKIGGLYKAAGTNPNKTRYSGTCRITLQPDGSYDFAWTIGSDTFSGTGILAGSTLTVDWGEADPVVYRVSPDGKRLDGVWGSGGQGKEILTR